MLAACTPVLSWTSHPNHTRPRARPSGKMSLPRTFAERKMTRAFMCIAAMVFLAGCGQKSEEGDAAYAERMAQEHAKDQPTASAAAKGDAAAPTKSQTVR